VGWVGRVWAFNSLGVTPGDPLVTIAGTDTVIEQLDIFNGSATTAVGLNIIGGKNHFKRIYMEGNFSTPVQFGTNGIQNHIGDLKVSMPTGLTVTSLITFGAASNKNVIDRVLTTLAGTTTVTNAVVDSALSITLPTANYEIADRPFSYSQAAGPIDGSYRISGAYVIPANKPLGVIVQTASGTITLPPLASARRQTYVIVNAYAGNITVQKSASDGSPTLIDGQTDQIRLYAQYESISLTSDGTQWVKVGSSKRSTIVPALTPAQITGNQNNYSPGEGGLWRLSSDASREISGIGGGGVRDGKRLTIINVGAQDIVLDNEEASSAAANRIITNTGADVTLGANATTELIYDETSQRWRMLY